MNCLRVPKPTTVPKQATHGVQQGCIATSANICTSLVVAECPSTLVFFKLLTNSSSGKVVWFLFCWGKGGCWALLIGFIVLRVIRFHLLQAYFLVSLFGPQRSTIGPLSCGPVGSSISSPILLVSALKTPALVI